MSGTVLVLNQNYEPLNICNVRRAIVLVFDGKAEILEQYDSRFARGDARVPVPLGHSSRLHDQATPATCEADAARDLHSR